MSFLVVGIFIGFLLRGKDRFIMVADKVTALAIYLLLFFLGISVGINEQVVNNIFLYGAKSLVLSTGAIVGSVVFSYFIYLGFFREIER
jgi:uncharacterized membrane protein YbjE (DUF340 family)